MQIAESIDVNNIWIEFLEYLLFEQASIEKKGHCDILSKHAGESLRGRRKHDGHRRCCDRHMHPGA